MTRARWIHIAIIALFALTVATVLGFTRDAYLAGVGALAAFVSAVQELGAISERKADEKARAELERDRFNPTDYDEVI